MNYTIFRKKNFGNEQKKIVATFLRNSFVLNRKKIRKTSPLIYYNLLLVLFLQATPNFNAVGSAFLCFVDFVRYVYT